LERVRLVFIGDDNQAASGSSAAAPQCVDLMRNAPSMHGPAPGAGSGHRISPFCPVTAGAVRDSDRKPKLQLW